MDAPYAVQLTLPALVDSVRLARLVAAGVAADAGWTMDDTEDLRIAVSELVALLVEGSEDPSHLVSLSYQRTEDGIEVTGLRPSGTADAPALGEAEAGAGDNPQELGDLDADDLALEILRVVVDDHDVIQDGAGRRFRVLKRARKHP